MISPAVPVYGPVFVGVFIDLMLLGIVINQISWYYTNFKRDQTWIKAYIALLVVVSVTNSVLNIIPVYSALVHHFGDVPRLGTAFWASTAAPALQASVASMVQLFLGWRINILLSKIWLMTFVMLLTVCQFLAGIGATIAIHKIPEFARFHEFKWMLFIWLGFTAAAGVVISGSLIFYVFKSMSNKTSSAGQLYRLILPTGLITAIISVVQLIALCASKQGIRMFFSLTLPYLYIVSLMASLNSRQGWKYTHESQGDLSEISSVNLAGEGNRSLARAGTRTVYTHKPDVMPLNPIRFSVSKDVEVEDKDSDHKSASIIAM